MYSILKTAIVWCTKADFRNSTSKRKAHSDHNVINDTAIAVGTSFYMLVLKNGQNRSYSHYFIHIQVAENATSTGHAKRGSVLVTIFGYKAPCRKTSLPSIADKATADNPVLRQCTTEEHQ